MTEVAALSDRDLLVRIANDSEHTKKSVEKLWEKNDEMSSTMSEIRTTSKAQSKTLDTMSEAVFTGQHALVPRVTVLESNKKSGQSGQHSIRIPAPVSQALDANKVVKMLGGILLTLITGIMTYFATK